MKEKEGLRCVLWFLGATDGLHPVNTEAQEPARAPPTQAVGLAPLPHSSALSPFSWLPRPGSQTFRVVFGSRLFSAASSSSSVCSFLFPPPLPPGCLPVGPAFKGWNAFAFYLPFLGAFS